MAKKAKTERGFFLRNPRGRVISVPERMLTNLTDKGYVLVKDAEGTPLNYSTTKPDTKPEPQNAEAKTQPGKEK